MKNSSYLLGPGLGRISDCKGIRRWAFVLLAAWPCALPNRVFAGAGTSGGTVLSVPVGARAIGMGEAFTAQADDVSSLYWNPAGIAILNQSQASFMYNQSIQDLSFNNASVAAPLEYGGLGASLSYLSYGPIDGFDEHDRPTSEVNAYSGVATLGGGWLLGPLSVGMNVKGVQSKLADVSATGAAVDLGGIYTYQQPVYGGTLRAGATLRNLGSGLKFIDQRDPFPFEWRLGVAAVQMVRNRLNLSMDFGKQRDVPGALYGGAEVWPVSNLALRAGWAGADVQGGGLRTGIGLRVKDFQFDYAYGSFGDLGMTHRYELSMRFGPIRPTLTPEEREMLHRAKVAMAKGRYDEATLLLDSLASMEPRYKYFRRLLKVAMRGYGDMEQVESTPPLALKGRAQEDDALDLKELSDLFQQSENAEREALARRQAESAAEQSTLAPLVPSAHTGDPNP